MGNVYMMCISEGGGGRVGGGGGRVGGGRVRGGGGRRKGYKGMTLVWPHLF